MTETTQPIVEDNVSMAVEIVSAYVSNNSVPLSSLSSLIGNVHAALAGLGATTPADVSGPAKATPAQIKKSISHDALISFEDGKPYKTLRRHLGFYGLTPEAYRAKWGLPADYPMTSSAYSAQRSELARALGLGQQRRNHRSKEEPSRVEASDETTPEKPKRAGRPRKAVETGEA